MQYTVFEFKLIINLFNNLYLFCSLFSYTWHIDGVLFIFFFPTLLFFLLKYHLPAETQAATKNDEDYEEAEGHQSPGWYWNNTHTHTQKLQQIQSRVSVYVCVRERLCSVCSHGTLWSSFINLLLMLWAKLSAVVVWTAVGGELVGPGTFDPFCAGDAGDKEGPASRASPSCILKPSNRELHAIL